MDAFAFTSMCVFIFICGGVVGHILTLGYCCGEEDEPAHDSSQDNT